MKLSGRSFFMQVIFGFNKLLLQRRGVRIFGGRCAQLELTRSTPARDRSIMIGIDASALMVIWVNGKGNMLRHTLNVLTHDLVESIFKWWLQPWQSHKTRPYSALKAETMSHHNVQLSLGRWGLSPKPLLRPSSYCTSFTYTCREIHTQLPPFINRLMFLLCRSVCVDALFACVVCVSVTLCVSRLARHCGMTACEK